MNRIDSKTFLPCVEQLDCDYAELYWQYTESLNASYQDRLTRADPAIAGGVTLRVKRSDQTHHYLRNDLDFDALFKDAGTVPAIRQHVPPTNPQGCDPFQKFIKTLRNEAFYYEETSREYGFASSDGRAGNGREESVRATFENDTVPIQVVRASIVEFWETLSKPSVLHRQRPRWPLPGGQVSILWKPEAMARLLVPFIQDFEGDRFLDGGTCLSRLNFPVPFRFRLVDRVLSQPFSDHEGTLQQNLCLFEDGRPRGLLCSLATATEVGVPPTGHCRRTSFEQPPIIGCWGPELTGLELCEDPLAALHNGIVIHQAAFSENLAAIAVNESQLVHNGAVGEWLEPFTLPLPLVDFLTSLSLFSKKTDTIGVEMKKSGQRYIVDGRFPWGLSPDLQSPGKSTVAYW